MLAAVDSAAGTVAGVPGEEKAELTRAQEQNQLEFLVLTCGSTMQGSFLQARCEEPIMTSDWGVPLVIALLLLVLLYAFLYLPALSHRALLEQEVGNQTTALPFTPQLG
ncbi:hypothetical protein AOLI_G00173040 [Acnodon oligacanthus]